MDRYLCRYIFFVSFFHSLQGEPFSQEELDEMMAVAVDAETGNIPYEYYINQIMVSNDTIQCFDVYIIHPVPIIGI